MVSQLEVLDLTQGLLPSRFSGTTSPARKSNKNIHGLANWSSHRRECRLARINHGMVVARIGRVEKDGNGLKSQGQRANSTLTTISAPCRPAASLACRPASCNR